MFRTELKEAGWTQLRLARKCGVTQAAVSYWLQRRVPPEHVLTVSEITGLTPNQLRPDVFGK